jgi:hypothetical protein
MHYPDMIVHGWTTLMGELTEESIMEQLRLRKTSVLFDAKDSPNAGDTPTSSTYQFFLPFILFGKALLNFYAKVGAGMWSFRGVDCRNGHTWLDWLGISLAFFWCSLLFIIVEILHCCWKYRPCCKSKPKKEKRPQQTFEEELQPLFEK